jgi:hypothetical protein
MPTGFETAQVAKTVYRQWQRHDTGNTTLPEVAKETLINGVPMDEETTHQCLCQLLAQGRVSLWRTSADERRWCWSHVPVAYRGPIVEPRDAAWYGRRPSNG